MLVSIQQTCIFTLIIHIEFEEPATTIIVASPLLSKLIMEFKVFWCFFVCVLLYAFFKFCFPHSKIIKCS